MVENNFFKAIKPAVVLCKVLGILPISHIDHNKKVVLLRFYLVYTMALTVLNIWIVFKMSAMVFQEDIVQVITDITVFIANELQLFVTFTNATIRKETWLNLGYAILKTDKLFTDLGIQLPDKKAKRMMYRYFTIRVVIIFSALKLGLYTGIIVNITECIYVCVVLVFNAVLNCCAALSVSRIKDGFEILNRLIQERVDAESDSKFAIPLKDFLPSACIIHQNLTKIMKTFNDCYGIILLATITATFLDVALCLYQIYMQLKIHNLAKVCNYGGFFALHVINMFTLCHLCEVTIEKVINVCFWCFFSDQTANFQGKQSVALIHRIRNTDYEIKDGIEMFSLQVAHELNDFTAAKVLPINHSLLFSVRVCSCMEIECF